MRFIKKVGKLAKFVISLQDAHEGGSAALVSDQSWSWACMNWSMDLPALAFWSKFRPWSEMNHDMEILEREKNHHARVEREARWSNPNCPLTNEHLVLQDLISSRASSVNLRRGHKIKSYATFYILVGTIFLWPFPYLSSYQFLLVFLKFPLLVTTSDLLVVTTFATVSRLFTGNSPQLTISKYEH